MSKNQDTTHLVVDKELHKKLKEKAKKKGKKLYFEVEQILKKELGITEEEV